MTSTRSSHKERKNGGFRQVFWWQLKNNRILILFYTGWVALGLPVATLCSILSNQDYYTNMNNWEGNTPKEVAQYFGEQVAKDFQNFFTIAVISAVIAYVVLYCCNAFGYMHSRRSTDLFHAIPVRRKPLLLGGYVIGLVTAVVPLAAGIALSQLVSSVYHIVVPAVGALFWGTFGLSVLLTAACLTFAMFFMVVSGTLLNFGVSLLATAGGWPLLCYVVDRTMSLFLPGYVLSSIPSGVYTALCPFGAFYTTFKNNFAMVYFGVYYEEAQTVVGEATMPYTASPGLILWWSCFTLLLLLAAVFCYDRRKSECAENNVSFPIVRGMIRFLLTLTGGLGLAGILGEMLNSNMVYLASVVAGSLITHVMIQVIWVRGFQKFWKTIPAYVFALLVSAGFLFALYEGGLGYVTRVPQVEQISKVEFELPGFAGDSSKECYLAYYANMDLEEKNGSYWNSVYPVFSKPEDVAAVTAFHQALLSKCPGPYLPCSEETDNGANDYYVSVKYTLNNGRVLRRVYTLPITEQDTELLSAVAAIQKRDTYQLYVPLYSVKSKHISGIYSYIYAENWEYTASNNKLTQEEKDRVWDTFLEELNSPSFAYKEGCLTDTAGLEESGYWATEPTREYTIDTSSIDVRELTVEQQALIAELTAEDPEVKADSIGMRGYGVPACCEKTRALIDELTADYGETYYYGGEEDNGSVNSEAAADIAEEAAIE